MRLEGNIGYKLIADSGGNRMTVARRKKKGGERHPPFSTLVSYCLYLYRIFRTVSSDRLNSSQIMSIDAFRWKYMYLISAFLCS